MRSNKPTSPINGVRCCRGSIVLEASIVMPAFVIVLFFFIYMVQMTLVVTQLHSVAANAVRQVSAHMYPIALAVGQQAGTKEDTGEGQPSGGSVSSTLEGIYKLSLADWAEQYTSRLPSPLNEWIVAAARQGDEPLQELKNSVIESVLDPVVKPLLRPFLEDTWLKEERLHVNRVTVPDLKTGKNPYFGLEISYELPIKIPFTGQPIVLQTRAEERLWIGDTDELDSNGQGNNDGNQGQPAVILSKPEPAYAGRRAKVSARIAPNTTAKLSVYYKSGVSQAKYLGEAASDADGTVDWEWLVGGNTTPGIWTFVVETEEGLITTEHFIVESPNSSK